MAEFIEIMRQATRMCDHYSVKGECSKCPLSRDNTECGHSLCVEISSINAKEAAEIERAVEAWAAEHPVPRLPTWNEWQESTFPDASDSVKPCSYASWAELDCSGVCDICRRKPIPSDIAEKLGVKLIEEGK